MGVDLESRQIRDIQRNRRRINDSDPAILCSTTTLHVGSHSQKYFNLAHLTRASRERRSRGEASSLNAEILIRWQSSALDDIKRDIAEIKIIILRKLADRD